MYSVEFIQFYGEKTPEEIINDRIKVLEDIWKTTFEPISITFYKNSACLLYNK